MEVTPKEIELYLEDIRIAVKNGNYRIEMGDRRKDNNDLFFDYVIDKSKFKEIVFSLNYTDFSERTNNIHKGFEHEVLYIFGKTVKLLERFGSGEKVVKLYIKFNKLDNNYVIVISFHEQRYPMRYYFQ